MTSKLLRQIHEHISKSSPMDMGEFSDLLYIHSEGMKKVEALWQKQNDDDGFPPKERNESDYYMLLHNRGILTNYQLDILLQELYLKGETDE